MNEGELYLILYVSSRQADRHEKLKVTYANSFQNFWGSHLGKIVDYHFKLCVEATTPETV